MPAIMFDLDGVLYEGNRVIPGAASTIEWFTQRSIPHIFLTNTSSRSRNALVSKLASYGITSCVDQFLTPPLATCRWLKQHNVTGPVALFIPDATMQEFADLSPCNPSSDKADAIIIGDLGSGWDFNTLNRAFRLLMNNPDAVLIALGMTRYWRAEDGLRLDAGPYVSALQYATGRKAIVLGKPAADFYHTALNMLNIDKQQCFMIGDDIKGDIDAAQKLGIPAILVRTGKFKPEDLFSNIKPYAVIDSIADLVPWWQQQLG